MRSGAIPAGEGRKVAPTMTGGGLGREGRPIGGSSTFRNRVGQEENMRETSLVLGISFNLFELLLESVPAVLAAYFLSSRF
jgi:hypothetical protein